MGSVTRKRSTTREGRRDAVRAKLLDAIQEVTAGGESYTNVSVERLASAAGISRATFYIYFADKGDLLQAWTEQTVGELHDAASAWWALDGSASRDDVREAIAGIFAAYRPNARLMAAVYDEATYDPDVREHVSRLIRGGIDGLYDHIRRGQKEGWVDPDLLPEETAAWMGWMLERGLNDIIAPAAPTEADELAETYVDLVWNVLYSGAAKR